jgi:tight adherence protein B
VSPGLLVAGVAVAAGCWWALPVGAGRPARGRPPARVLWLAAPLLLLVVPPALVAAALVVAVGGQRLWSSRRARRRAAATAAGVLEAVELVAAEVSAGAPPATALRHATDAWPPLGAAAEAATLGGEVPAVLRRLAAEPGADRLRLVAAAWEVAHRSGAGLADALGAVGAGLRADRATARVVEGELASARATARLVAALPAFALLVSSTTGGGAWAFVTSHPLGWACLLGGLLLGLAGLTWIERIAAGVHP